MKLCRKCQIEKSTSEFYRHIKTSDGLWPECKACNIARSRKWIALNRERKRAFDRKSWSKHREERILGLKRSYDNREYGGNRERVIQRDGEACVKCGMTREDHRQRWNADINVDHISRDRSDNTMKNLQTLCLFCHGKKDNGSIVKPRF